MTSKLDKEYKFYLENKEDLLKKYKNKVIVIVGHEVIGAYKNEKEAVIAASKKHKLGTFLVQRCTGEEQVMMYTSIVTFS